MSLEQEIALARKEIVSDGYDMSLGEVINLYKEKELKINPVFQRLFRWDISRKTKFIESIILGIPIPPIFVFQSTDGTWELIDGLQRLSTVLEFCGLLRDNEGNLLPPSRLEGTKYLPSLSNITWDKFQEGDIPIEKMTQLQIKRARIRVEILLKESDVNAKYELFQRLNTGGAQLSEQEVRNSVAVMINEEFFNLLNNLSNDINFVHVINQTEVAEFRQMPIELVLRFLSLRIVPYSAGLDIHEYLDDALIQLAESTSIDWSRECQTFKDTFELLNTALGINSFKRWSGTEYSGKFLISLFEVVAIGLSINLDLFKAIPHQEAIDRICALSKSLKDEPVFARNSGGGVRGTTRLANLLPLARDFFKP